VLAVLIFGGLAIAWIVYRGGSKGGKPGGSSADASSDESRTGVSNGVEMAETGNARDDSRANLDGARHENEESTVG
jgi:hypothetical protein